MKTKIVNPILKDEVTFIQSSHESNGIKTVLAVKLMPGGGTPFHFHKNIIEQFTISEGKLTIYQKGKKNTLVAGEKLTVGLNIVHRFANESDSPVIFNTTLFPGSPGFENSLKILYGLACDGKTNRQGIPKSFLNLAVISMISDMHQPGILSLLSPVIHLAFLIAKLTKTDKKLFKKYCQ
ncbi:MAG: cupin domain-containing protein [Sphingobacterium sp.]